MEQVHEGRINHVMKPAIETLVYHNRKGKSMSLLSMSEINVVFLSMLEINVVVLHIFLSCEQRV